jgi:hypothetical protein
MKRLILVACFAIMVATAHAQSTSPFYTGITIGKKTDANKMPITKVTGTGSKVAFYSGSMLLNPVSGDTVTAKSILVLRPDSIYQKPGSYTSRYDFKNEPVKSELLKAYNGFGSTIKMLPLCPPEFNDSYALTDGRAIFTLCYTADSITVTGFKYSLLVAGSYTADNYNGIALYSFSNGVITKISETANDGTIWTTTANTIGIKNLPSPVTIAPGYYYIAILYNSSAQTTAPTFPSNSIGVLINAAQGWTNNSSIALNSFINTQSTLPTPITMQGTVSGISPFMIGILAY